MEHCIFCRKTGAGLLCENELAKAFYDNFPVNVGHTLIAPKRHVASFFEADKDELGAMNELIIQVRGILDKKYKPDGYNIGTNVGRAGGQTIFHLHTHLIPRYLGDVKNPRGGIRKIKKSIVSYPLEDEKDENGIYKLVRDKIPEIIQASGGKPVYRAAGDEEYKHLLKEKLWEKMREFAAADNAEKLADIWEVMKALAKDRGIEWGEVEKLARSKKEERGGFDKRFFLERIN